MEVDEGWEEEQLVLVDLVGLLEHEVLFKATTEHCRLHGIDSEEPILQIGPYTFTGHYEDVLGTHCIFEQKIGTGKNPPKYKFKAKTTKCLKMSRAFLKNKSENSDDSSDSSNESDDEKNVNNMEVITDNQQSSNLDNSHQGNLGNVQDKVTMHGNIEQ